MSPEVKDVLQGLTLAANLWMFLYLRRLERQKASDNHLKELERLISSQGANVNERLTALETRAESAPSHDDIKRIHARIDELGSTLHELVGKSTATNHTLLLIQDHLLNGIRK